MSLTPQDIVRREFREAFRGYNQADVDLFLDEVVDEFGRLYDENQKMKVRLAALQQELARFREGRGSSPRSEPEATQIDSEVRARVRRFLEDLLRQVEGAPAAPERAPAPPPARPAAPHREPFWAGE